MSELNNGTLKIDYADELSRESIKTIEQFKENG